MTNNSQSSKGFNLIDLLITLLILMIIAAALYSYVPGIAALFTKDDAKIEYTFVLRSVREETVAGISTGDSVICDKVDFGNVKSVSLSSSDSYAYSEVSKSVVVNTSNEIFDALIVVSANADKLSDAYTVSGKTLSAGLEYEIVLPDYAGTALCLSVVEVSE